MITNRPLTAVIAIALICVLVGLGIGQITQASGGGGAQLRKVSKNVKRINTKLGDTGTNGTIADQLEALSGNVDDAAERADKAKDLALVVCTDVDPDPSICHNINNR